MYFTINEGIAIDTRLLRSVRKSMSNENIKKFTNKRGNYESNWKKDNPLKFSRDIESDWKIKNDKPFYDLKEYDSGDVDNSFIMDTTISSASFHGLNYLLYCTEASCHAHDPIKKVYAE